MIVEFSRLARRELIDIGLWIAQDDPDTATLFVNRLEAACQEIGERPRLYPLLRGGRSIRKRLVGRYLILFRVRRSVVTIVSIHHGARRPPTF